MAKKRKRKGYAKKFPTTIYHPYTLPIKNFKKRVKKIIGESKALGYSRQEAFVSAYRQLRIANEEMENFERIFNEIW